MEQVKRTCTTSSTIWLIQKQITKHHIRQVIAGRTKGRLKISITPSFTSVIVRGGIHRAIHRGGLPTRSDRRPPVPAPEAPSAIRQHPILEIGRVDRSHHVRQLPPARSHRSPPSCRRRLNRTRDREAPGSKTTRGITVSVMQRSSNRSNSQKKRPNFLHVSLPQLEQAPRKSAHSAWQLAL
jgi:hypothetical protein